MCKKKPKTYSPAPYAAADNLEEKYTAEQIAAATKLVEQEEEKKAGALQKLSAFWTLLTVIYSIVTTCIFVSRDWIDSTFSRILIVVLVVYVVAFLIVCALAFRNPKKLKVSLKTYKRLLKIFKAFSNVVFLCLTAVSMASIAAGGMSVLRWIVFGATFFVAIVKLGIDIALLVLRSVRRRVARKYRVKIQTYVNGKAQKSKFFDRIKEKTYK